MVDIARPAQTPIARKNTVVSLEPCARASLRVAPGAIGGITVLAANLDIPINTMAGDRERMNVRLGPDEWLLITPEAENESLAHEIDRALRGSFFSLVDVSHRSVAFEVAGPHARDILNGECPLDLDDAAFPSGTATRTVLGKSEIVLMRPRTEYTYRIECLRSFGPYVHGLLNELSRQFEED